MFNIQVPNLARAIAAEHLLQVKTWPPPGSHKTNDFGLFAKWLDRCRVSVKHDSFLIGLPHPWIWHGQSRKQKVIIFIILVEKKEMGGWRDLLNVLLQGYRRRTGRRRDGSGGQSERGLQVFFLKNLAPNNKCPQIFDNSAKIMMHSSGKLLTWLMLTVQEA